MRGRPSCPNTDTLGDLGREDDHRACWKDGGGGAVPWLLARRVQVQVGHCPVRVGGRYSCLLYNPALNNLVLGLDLPILDT